MKTSIRQLTPILALVMATFLPPATNAATEPQSSTAEFDKAQLEIFAQKAALAKKLGATHVPITDDLPTSQWQFQPAGDPYPAWFIQRPDFFKLFPAPEVEPFVDMDYGKRVAGIIEKRCEILRKLGLKAHWAANIPQVMPEAFFTAHPELRGPRVDQPNRSRTARFSMCVDQPETVRLYTVALKNLLERCPEIESFAFLTQDSGSGFCWALSLYPGANGPASCKESPMSDRISTFLVALKNAAKDSGHDVEISLNPITPRQWMLPTFSPEELEAIWHKLPRGVAVQGREGPDGRPFARLGSSDAYSRGEFHPVVGLDVPNLGWLHTGRVGARRAKAAGEPERRLISLRPDLAGMESGARLSDAMRGTENGTVPEKLAALRTFAAGEVGEAHADELLAIWLSLDDAQRQLDSLNFGSMLYFGSVLNRWVNRPMVPFPDELTDAEKAHYRPFLFQAKGEEQAGDLIDIQAMRMYEGFGARLLFQRVIEITVPSVENAMRNARRLGESASDDAGRARWDLFARRLEAAICLLHTADHMVSYQAQLDRVKSLGNKPEENPPLGARGSWDRDDLWNLARAEIDNTAHLKRLLDASKEPLLDLAPIAGEETIMRLGPDLSAQLQRKIDVMNAHWMDYDRLFTKPNP